MKKVDKNTSTNNDTSTVSDRYYWYDKLHFVPIEEKNVIWAAQNLSFVKQNAVHFVKPDEAFELRRLEDGEINPDDYKRMIDPVLPDSTEQINRQGIPVSGENHTRAEFFHADWKSCPIFVHLDNILEAKIKQIPLNLFVKSADEFSELKKQKVNAQILGRTQFTNFINDFNSKIGYPPINKMDDPFRYAGELKNGIKQPNIKKIKNPKNILYKQPPTGLIDNVKASIDDSEGLALFNSYIYKGGEEIACEIGIKYYMLEQNKFLNKAKGIVSDIKNFNKYAVRFYTSETTGRPVIEHLPIEHVHVLPFKEDDGSDLKAWYIEYDVTFGDFVQMFGAGLNKQQLRDVFEANYKIHNVQADDYEKIGRNARNASRIRIGYFEWESQDMEVYSDYEAWGNAKYKKQKSDFKPEPDRITNSKRDEAHYNVWYKMYYIPSLLESSIADFNLDNQAKTIYKFGKLQDQQRDGDDFRYSKPSLMVTQSRRMTWASIVNRFMPKINFMWFQFQNEMVNSVPNGLYFAERLVTSMANVADNANNNAQTAKIDFMRKLRQTGWGVGEMLTDENGNIIGDGMPFREMKNSMMEGAFQKLEGMMTIYQLMMQALGQSDISEGAAPKPRQNLGGIQLALTATTQSQYFIEAPYMDLVLELAKKHIYYFKEIVDEGNSERLQDFKNIVGEANGTAFEAIADIPFHNLGLSVENVMTDDQKKLVNDLAMSLASAGVLMPEDALFISLIDDLKYAYAILALKAKAGRKLMAQQQQAQAQAEAQSAQQATQLKIAEIKAQGDNILASVNAGKQWDMKIDQMVNQLKGEFQIQLKQMVSQNKTTELITKNNIEHVNNDKGDAVVAA